MVVYSVVTLTTKELRSGMKKLRDKIKKIGIFKIILLLLLIAAVIVGIRIYRSAQDLKAQVSQALYTVVHPEDHDIVKMISGSGTSSITA